MAASVLPKTLRLLKFAPVPAGFDHLAGFMLDANDSTDNHRFRTCRWLRLNLGSIRIDSQSQGARWNRLIRFRGYNQNTRTCMFVNRLLHTTVVFVSILALFTASDIAQAGPMGLFFRVVRGTIPH